MKDIFLKHGLEISDKQIEMFDEYYGLLAKWNTKINLTHVIEYEDVIWKHFLDSSWILTCKEFPLQDCLKILDVGTGAGFPGIVLSILRPEDSFVLLDSLRKRVDFLSLVVETLKLKNVTLYHGRAEDYARRQDFRNQFDIVVSRAVAELPLLLEYCIPFVKENGYFVSYKGKKYLEEIEKADNAMKVLNCGVDHVEKYQLDYKEKVLRYLLFIKNYSLTNSRYPRKAGKPAKNPL